MASEMGGWGGGPQCRGARGSVTEANTNFPATSRGAILCVYRVGYSRASFSCNQERAT